MQTVAGGQTYSRYSKRSCYLDRARRVQKPVLSRDKNVEGLVNRHFLIRGIIFGLEEKLVIFINKLGN